MADFAYFAPPPSQGAKWRHFAAGHAAVRVNRTHPVTGFALCRKQGTCRSSWRRTRRSWSTCGTWNGTPPASSTSPEPLYVAIWGKKPSWPSLKVCLCPAVWKSTLFSVMWDKNVAETRLESEAQIANFAVSPAHWSFEVGTFAGLWLCENWNKINFANHADWVETGRSRVDVGLKEK